MTEPTPYVRRDTLVTAESLGPLVPRRGTAFSQRIGLLWLRLIGWRITGTPPMVAKAIFIGAPHTSNRDGFVAVATALAIRLRINVMAKAELFNSPLGPLFRWMGVMPVYRRGSRGGQVEQVVARFAAEESVYIGIAPEGTRHASPAWKTGFYHMAVKAGVPIVPFILDFGRKELHMLPAFYPTGDLDADLPRLMAPYHGIIPADPSRLSLPLREPLATHAEEPPREPPAL
ncbi:MAG: lysophospholipid acyltransferase family protein [Paraperlucidibaca sp.]